jgi:hypothetical protein
MDLSPITRDLAAGSRGLAFALFDEVELTGRIPTYVGGADGDPEPAGSVSACLHW